jgi:glycosyltransferase involved in cell wall biosynthesis
MNNISVAIAVHNEEGNIEICLKSVQDWVDEIVVVDGESTDKTVELLKQHKVKIIHGKNIQMFHLNKQKAIDACKSKWVLQLDADEQVSTELKNEILLNIQKDHANGYWLPRKNYFLGRFLTKGGQYPDFTLRLYKKGKGRLPCKSVHEQAVVEGTTGYLKNPLFHYPYPDFSHYLEHFYLYTGIFAKELQSRHTPFDLSQLLQFMVIKPWWWFLKTYFRHKGFMDGIQGFLFSFFSSLRFPFSYIKYWELQKNKKV